MMGVCIVVGASHAAVQLAVSLRQEGWAGRVLIIGDEEQLPYHRPPLSKAFLAGERDLQGILIRTPAAFEKYDIELQLGVRVESINRIDKTIALDTGLELAYDKLALCTGSRARKLSIRGADLDGVHYLRSVNDVERIKKSVVAGGRAVIVGGGYIGLEAAAQLCQLGMHVTVLEMASRVLSRVTAPELSEFYSRIHREEGVLIETGVAVSSLEGGERVNAVLTDDGRRFGADLLIVGVGVLPNTELAEAAGLALENGLLIDEFSRTSDPSIVAAGDVTSQHNSHYGRRLRLESVPSAVEQAISAAASVCGKHKHSGGIPWFWSDQYDLKLQIAGLSEGYDQLVIRGDSSKRSFVAFYLKNSKLISADCVNRPQEFMVSKRLIATNALVDPKRLADESVPAKEICI